MNTTAHILLGGAALPRGRQHGLAIALGGLAPDLPMFVFYLIERLFLRRSEKEIWGTLYYDPTWQAFFDVPNSLPLIAIAGAFAYGLARRRGRSAPLFFTLAMGIHALADFFVHREDGHRHLFPFSDWRFISPVSYWDPDHHGLLFGALEAAGVLTAVVWFVRRGPSVWRRIAVVVGLLHFGFGVFAAITWGGLF